MRSGNDATTATAEGPMACMYAARRAANTDGSNIVPV
jgi:hypothetical protein